MLKITKIAKATALIIFMIWFKPDRLFSQKIDYKSNTINVDGNAVATVNRIKDKGSFGLISTYELLSMDGKKLAIATIATDFVPAYSDNTGYYYRLTFLPSNQVGIFTLNKLGAEKSFAKLIGESGIVVNNQLDEAKVNELIALHGKNPRVRVNYDLVNRNRMMNVRVDENRIVQGDVVIGLFKDVSINSSFDAYEFSLPSGLVVAKVSFTGGNAAKNCLIITFKDEQAQRIQLSGTNGRILAKSETVDRNRDAIQEISRWLVSKFYM